MLKTTLIAASLMTFAGIAHAGGQENTLGVGAEYQLSGIGGISVNYDLGKMHFGGFLGFADDGNDNTDYTVGGQFYYHIHNRGQADFGIGGSIGWFSNEMMNNRATLVYLEPGIQIRAFITPNVALSATAGIVLGLDDADGVALTGATFNGAGPILGLGGGAGIHYYFF